MELSSVGNGECGQWLQFWVQFHLPETGGEIQSCENGRIRSSDVPEALADFLHGVFIDVRVLVEQPEVLYNSESLALFLRHAEDG